MAGLTQEEKVAVKLADMLSNLQLDIETVGVYFAEGTHEAVFRRFLIMCESAMENKKTRNQRIEEIVNNIREQV
jgi:hypothetical protein